MGKLIRNTVFTIAVLGLAAVGISWNRSTIGSHRGPLVANHDVLASPALESDPSMPLALEFSRPSLKLGQYQVMSIHTRAGADIELTTIYPGATNTPDERLTVKADEQGNYQRRFQLDDFHNIGKFTVFVSAVSNGQVARSSGEFILESWAMTETKPSTTPFVYPLLP
jgi:hypothetical protein